MYDKAHFVFSGKSIVNTARVVGCHSFTLQLLLNFYSLLWLMVLHYYDWLVNVVVVVDVVAIRMIVMGTLFSAIVYALQ
jgi:hypothetical protein